MKKCTNCGGDIAIRNPTGKCDHLYYPENVPKQEFKVGIEDVNDHANYTTSDYRAKMIMEDFAINVNRHGFTASGRIDLYIQSIINWKNDCVAKVSKEGELEYENKNI